LSARRLASSTPKAPEMAAVPPVDLRHELGERNRPLRQSRWQGVGPCSASSPPQTSPFRGGGEHHHDPGPVVGGLDGGGLTEVSSRSTTFCTCSVSQSFGLSLRPTSTRSSESPLGASSTSRIWKTGAAFASAVGVGSAAIAAATRRQSAVHCRMEFMETIGGVVTFGPTLLQPLCNANASPLLSACASRDPRTSMGMIPIVTQKSASCRAIAVEKCRLPSRAARLAVCACRAGRGGPGHHSGAGDHHGGEQATGGGVLR